MHCDGLRFGNQGGLELRVSKLNFDTVKIMVKNPACSLYFPVVKKHANVSPLSKIERARSTYKRFWH